MKKKPSAKPAHKKRSMLEGLPIKDGHGSITIHVTPKDIHGSSKKDPGACAAARACQRELHKEVRVYLTRTYVREKDHWARYITPESASREIVSFDRGSSFEPGEYVVKAPVGEQRLGHHRGRSTKLETGPNRPRPHHATALIREWKTRR